MPQNGHWIFLAMPKCEYPKLRTHAFQSVKPGWRQRNYKIIPTPFWKTQIFIWSQPVNPSLSCHVNEAHIETMRLQSECTQLTMLCMTCITLHWLLSAVSSAGDGFLIHKHVTVFRVNYSSQSLLSPAIFHNSLKQIQYGQQRDPHSKKYVFITSRVSSRGNRISPVHLSVPPSVRIYWRVSLGYQYKPVYEMHHTNMRAILD